MPVIAVACVELDGSDQRPGIFIIGATNRYDNISLLSSPLLSITLIKACVSGGRPEVMERLSITLTSLRLISYKICFLYL